MLVSFSLVILNLPTLPCMCMYVYAMVCQWQILFKKGHGVISDSGSVPLFSIGYFSCFLKYFNIFCGLPDILCGTFETEVHYINSWKCPCLFCHAHESGQSDVWGLVMLLLWLSSASNFCAFTCALGGAWDAGRFLSVFLVYDQFSALSVQLWGRGFQGWGVVSLHPLVPTQ